MLLEKEGCATSLVLGAEICLGRKAGTGESHPDAGSESMDPQLCNYRCNQPSTHTDQELRHKVSESVGQVSSFTPL